MESSMEGAIAEKQSFPLPRPPPGDGGSSHNKATEGPAASTRGKTIKDKNKSKLAEKVRDLQKQGAEVLKSIKADKTTQDMLQRILDGLTELETMATRQEQACQKEHNENSGKDGRNNDLAAIIGVPGITPECSCGHQRQTIQHVLGYCPDQVEARTKLIGRTGHTQMDRLLRERDTAKWAGQWLLDTGLLEYLQVALKVEATNTGDWAPFTNA